YTVEFTFPMALATAMDDVSFPIIPKHILEQPWKEGRFNEMWGVDTPPWEIIGTGPFQMVEYRPSERIVMTRNPNCWRVDAEGNPLPYITRFVMYIAGNQDAMRLMFDNRETNIYSVRGTEVDEMQDNAERGGYTIYEGGPTFSTLFVVFNQNELFVPSPKVEWFQNKLFRQAVAHAVDKQSLIDIVFGGRTDNIMMRIGEVVMAVPSFYLLIALAGVMRDVPAQQRFAAVIAILGLVSWAGFARVIRGMVLSLRQQEFVEGALAIGNSHLRTIVRHILPNTISYVVVSITLPVPGFIIAESSLSFLGLGVQEPFSSWGNMLSNATDLTNLTRYPWMLAPGFLIFITVLAWNYVGDGVRDALDPRAVTS